MKSLKNINIAIIEDDKYYAGVLKAHIEKHLVKAESNLIYNINVYNSAHDCVTDIKKDIDIVILDYYLEEQQEQSSYTGKELLKIINGFCDDCRVIVVSGQKDQDVAIELFKIGIYEYIIKDEDTLIRLSSTLRRAIRDKILEHYI